MRAKPCPWGCCPKSPRTQDCDSKRKAGKEVSVEIGAMLTFLDVFRKHVKD